MSVTPAPSIAQPPAQQPAAPPQGTAPVTQQTPNRGTEVMSAQLIGLILQLMGRAIGVAGAGTEAGQALADCIRKLGKYSTSAGSPAANQDALKQLQLQQLQQQNMMQRTQPGQSAQ